MLSEDRVKKIKEYFSNLSLEEFESKLVKAGIEEIQPISSYEVDFKNNIKYELDSEVYNIKKEEFIVNKEVYYNNFPIVFARAV